MHSCYPLLLSVALSISLTAQTQLGDDILADIAPGRTGIALALSQDGNRLLVADDFYSPGDAIQLGAIQLWEWNGTTWNKVGAPVVGESNFDKIGPTLAMNADGTRFAYGIASSGFDPGEVRVFELTAGEWQPLGAAFTGESNERLGTDVSLSADGRLLAIGAAPSGFSPAQPMARVFEWTGSDWTLRGQPITDPAPATSTNFGAYTHLSADGNRLLVADNLMTVTTTRLYTYDWTGTDWEQVGQPIAGQSDADEFGRTLALSQDGNRMAVGAQGYDTDGASNEGFVEVYDWTGIGWSRVGATLYGDPDQWLGSGVALSDDGGLLVVGARGSINTDGQVSLYEVANDQLSLTTTIEETDGTFSGDGLGTAVALSGSGGRVAVGEPDFFDDGLSSNSGRVRVFAVDDVATESVPILGVALYPNPTTACLSVSDGLSASWTVYDAYGRLLVRQTGNHLSMVELPAGVYTVRIERLEGELLSRVVKR